MNKLILVLPAVIPLLSSCNNSSPTIVLQPLPKITACPGNSEEEKDYSPMEQMTLLADVKAGKNQKAFQEAFAQGDLLFGTNFTLEHGGRAYKSCSQVAGAKPGTGTGLLIAMQVSL
jgi:hypothetical protein